MHEISLVRDLLAQVDQAMRDNGIQSISVIQIEVGPLSGVEALLVEQAYLSLIASSPFENVRLTIDQPLLMAICRECDTEFSVMEFHFVCPNCSSSKVQVTSGDAMRLVSISTSIECDSTEKTGASIK